MDDTRWDHGLTVTGEGQGLVGHAGAVLLRKLADQAGLTAALGAALARRGKFPLVDRVSRWCPILRSLSALRTLAMVQGAVALTGPSPTTSSVDHLGDAEERRRGVCGLGEDGGCDIARTGHVFTQFGVFIAFLFQ